MLNELYTVCCTRNHGICLLRESLTLYRLTWVTGVLLSHAFFPKKDTLLMSAKWLAFTEVYARTSTYCLLLEYQWLYSYCWIWSTLCELHHHISYVTWIMPYDFCYYDYYYISIKLYDIYISLKSKSKLYQLRIMKKLRHIDNYLRKTFDL
jgi:hypothetical protein